MACYQTVPQTMKKYQVKELHFRKTKTTQDDSYFVDWPRLTRPPPRRPGAAKVLGLEPWWGIHQRKGKCSSEVSALYDMLFHQMHLCSGGLMVLTIHTQKWFLGAGLVGAPPISLNSSKTGRWLLSGGHSVRDVVCCSNLRWKH